MSISLFLGAGASVPFGMPTTKQFKEKLSGIPEIQDEAIMRGLFSALDLEDIEHILQAIEDIENIDKHGKMFLERLLFTSEPKLTGLSFDELLNGLDSCRRAIIKQVYKLYSFDNTNIEKVKTHYDPIFRILDSKKIHVFTTNYDQVVEEYVRDNDRLTPNDGFEHDKSATKNFFNPDSFDTNSNDGKTQVNIYKLHGSLNWKKMNGDIIRQEREEQNQNEFENILIYPTLNPKNGLDEEPHKAIYSKFQAHIENTGVFVVIGYSFRDEHINDIFKKFVELGKILIIISPTVDSDLKDIDFISDYNSVSVLITDEIIAEGHEMTQILEEGYQLVEQKTQKEENMEAYLAKENTSKTDREFLQLKEEVDNIEMKLASISNRQMDQHVDLQRLLPMLDSNIYKIPKEIEYVNAGIIDCISMGMI